MFRGKVKFHSKSNFTPTYAFYLFDKMWSHTKVVPGFHVKHKLNAFQRKFNRKISFLAEKSIFLAIISIKFQKSGFLYPNRVHS